MSASIFADSLSASCLPRLVLLMREALSEGPEPRPMGLTRINSSAPACVWGGGRGETAQHKL
jgi:hypothetical protein